MRLADRRCLITTDTTGWSAPPPPTVRKAAREETPAAGDGCPPRREGVTGRRLSSVTYTAHRIDWGRPPPSWQ
jgi:hypothetical protein